MRNLIAASMIACLGMSYTPSEAQLAVKPDIRIIDVLDSEEFLNFNEDIASAFANEIEGISYFLPGAERPEELIEEGKRYFIRNLIKEWSGVGNNFQFCQVMVRAGEFDLQWFPIQTIAGMASRRFHVTEELQYFADGLWGFNVARTQRDFETYIFSVGYDNRCHLHAYGVNGVVHEIIDTYDRQAALSSFLRIIPLE